MRKKTCEKCKALREITHSYNCSLGYKIELINSSWVGISIPCPVEICPKPRTNKAYIDCIYYNKK